MATYYAVAGSFQTVQVQSQTSAPDMEAVGIYTKPSGVYAVALVPLAAFDSGKYSTYLESPALLIEQLMGNDLGGGQSVPTYVSGAQSVQLQDASGLLAYFMSFKVVYQATTGAAGTFSGYVPIPMTSLMSDEAFVQPIQGGTPSALIKAKYDSLKALANS